jgi:hypothetical protein
MAMLTDEERLRLAWESGEEPTTVDLEAAKVNR